MSNSADNQQPERPLSEVGARAWGLASSRIGAARGLRIFRSPFQPLARTPSARYLMRWIDSRPAELTLLRRLPQPDEDQAFAPYLDPEAMPAHDRSTRRVAPERAAEPGQSVQRSATAGDTSARPAPVRPAPSAAQRLQPAATPDVQATAAALPAERAALPKVRPAQPGAPTSDGDPMSSVAPTQSPVLGAAPAPLPLLMRAPALSAAHAGAADAPQDAQPAPAPRAAVEPSRVQPLREPASSPASATLPDPATPDLARVAPASASPATPELPRVAPAPPSSRVAAPDTTETSAPALSFLAPLLRPASFAADVAGATGHAPRAPLPLAMRAPAEPLGSPAAPGAAPAPIPGTPLAPTSRLQPSREPAAPAQPATGGPAQRSLPGAPQAAPGAAAPATPQRPGEPAQPAATAPAGEATPALPRIALPAVNGPGAPPAADAGPSLPFLAPILRRASFALDPAEAPGAPDETPRAVGAPGFVAPASGATVPPQGRPTPTGNTPLVQPRRLAPVDLPSTPAPSERAAGMAAPGTQARSAQSPVARPGALGSAAAATAATLARRLDPALGPADAPAEAGAGATAAATAATLARRLDPALGPADAPFPASTGTAPSAPAATLARRLDPAQRPGMPAAPAGTGPVQLERVRPTPASARLPQTAQSPDDPAAPFAAHAAPALPAARPELPRVGVHPVVGGSTLPLLHRSLTPTPLDAVPDHELAPTWSGGAPSSLERGGWPAPGSLGGNGSRGQIPPGTLAGRPELARPAPTAPSADLLRPIAPVQRMPDLSAVGAAVGNAASAVSSTASAVSSTAAALTGELTQSAQQAQPAAEPDIDAIAQKVYEQLRRRLRIDQERLGKY